MSITAQQVMELRERTGAGMMECKKFLMATQGNIDEAIAEMRKAGQAKADKKADRLASEGVVVVARSADARTAVMVEVNSETDFVARDTHFLEFVQRVGQVALSSGVSDIAQLLQQLYAEGQTIEEARQHLVAKIGENIQLRRMERASSTDGMVGIYTHGSRIGVMVILDASDEELAKDLAMHIAASKPQVVSRDAVDPAVIASEREIYLAQARETGKPAEILEKIVEGRIVKFLEEVSLLGQPFVKNPDVRVEQLLKQKGRKVEAFVRMEVGEGLEKKQGNFVEEVMSQVRS
ncbi:MAG: translation elongation factor Ts [Legionellaceae bacterium]|nr:translation elongation factor Ts [Legionellaceae bacterium]